VAGSLLSYEACMYKRKVEREGMLRAAQIMELKRKEIEKRKAAAEELKAKKKAEEEAAKKSWYKIW
jgi:cytochrome c oxidase assembly protein subunit 20